MKQYKVSVLRIGVVLVWEEDAREAKEKIQRLSMDRFHWLDSGGLSDYGC